MFGLPPRSEPFFQGGTAAGHALQDSTTCSENCSDEHVTGKEHCWKPAWRCSLPLALLHAVALLPAEGALHALSSAFIHCIILESIRPLCSHYEKWPILGEKFNILTTTKDRYG